jgi:hypothetical protein
MTHPTRKYTRFERDFARALDWEIAKSRSRNYRTVAARLRKLERLYVSPARESGASVEIRRRIAEQVFQQALSHDCSWTLCRAKFRALCKLGFTNLELKAHFHLLYARAALSRGSSRLAHRTATAMIRELKSGRKHSRNPLRKELMDLTQALLLEAAKDS